MSEKELRGRKFDVADFGVVTGTNAVFGFLYLLYKKDTGRKLELEELELGEQALGHFHTDAGANEILIRRIY